MQATTAVRVGACRILALAVRMLEWASNAFEKKRRVSQAFLMNACPHTRFIVLERPIAWDTESFLQCTICGKELKTLG